MNMTNVYYKIRGYAQMKAKLHVRLAVSGSSFHAGMILAGWGCCGGAGLVYDGSSQIPLLNASQLSTLPHVKLLANSNGASELCLPFMHQNGYFEVVQTPASNYDNLRLRVIAPLLFYNTSATYAAPSISISIYAWFSDVELCTPVPQSELSGNLVMPRPGSVSVRGFASRFARTVADAALSAAGLGSPNVPPQPAAVYETHPLRIKANGTTSYEVLRTHDAIEDDITPVSSENDPMDFKNIYSREALLAIASWTDAATPQMLAYFPVSPFLAYQTGITNGGRTNGMQLLPMGFIGAPFSKWRGTISFRVQVVAPKTVRGTLRLRYMPRTYNVPSLVLEQADVYTVEMDISETTEAEMVIPYCAVYPWLNSTFPVNSSNRPDSTQGNGTFVIDIMSPLVSQGIGVSVVVWAKGVDLKFAEPDSRLKTGNAYCILQNTVVYPQTMALDTFTSIRDAVKVPCVSMLCSPNLVDSSSIGRMYTLHGTPTMAGQTGWTPTQEFITLIAWYSSAFLMRRGKFRVRGVSLIGSDTGSAGYPFNIWPAMWAARHSGVAVGELTMDYSSMLLAMQILIGNVAAYQPLNEDLALGIEIPPLGGGEYMPARCVQTNSISYPVVRFFTDQGPTTNVANSTIPIIGFYESAADDFSLDVFQFVPVLWTGNP